MRGRAAAVRDRHRAAQVVHLPQATCPSDSGANATETSALQLHVHYQVAKGTTIRCMLAQLAGGRARQRTGRALPATQTRDDCPVLLEPCCQDPARAARLRQVNGLHVIRGVVVADLPAGPVERLYPEQLALLHGANLRDDRQSAVLCSDLLLPSSVSSC